MIAVVVVRAGQLPTGGAEAIAECNGRALLVGSQLTVALAELGGIATHVTAVEFADFLPGAWAHALAPLLADEPAIVLPGSPDGRDLAPRLASLLHRPLFAGATSISPQRIEMARNGGRELHSTSPGPEFVATLKVTTPFPLPLVMAEVIVIHALLFTTIQPHNLTQSCGMAFVASKRRPISKRFVGFISTVIGGDRIKVKNNRIRSHSCRILVTSWKILGREGRLDAHP